ncbi:amino acid adenylation domain-containing protein, partial [Gordonia sp. DT30]|uniref:amino acid adenylation domain-containing protein n=1 Tax=Gordonia sp. DT30 TaxID=3416546 RepID=UPI003CE89A38
MTGIDANAKETCSGWGHRPGTRDLIAVTARTAPEVLALSSSTVSLTFGELEARVAPMATVFAGRGIHGDAAVAATIAPLVTTPGADPAASAALTQERLRGVRTAAVDTLGGDDWQSLPGLFRLAVRRFGARLAVTDTAGAGLTYRELDERSDAVARGLLASGVAQGSVVGLATSRSVDVMVAILGILKVGATYLPLDTSHPGDRLQMIVDDAAPVVVIADPGGHATLDALGVGRTTTADLGERGHDGSPALPAALDPRLGAYTIFTSGSTGRPKGVVVEHRSVVALLAAAQQHYGFTEYDVWTMFHSYAFDVSVFEMWGPLLFGGRLLVVDYLTTRSPVEFAALLAEQSVTVVSQTPSAFYQLAAAVRPRGEATVASDEMPSSVRYMVFAGEALDFAQVTRWYSDRMAGRGGPGPLLVNMYGITETTVHSTFRALDPEFVSTAKGSDVGDGLPGLTVRVLDDRLRPVPDGMPGEIYVSGTQVTRGYLGRPELTGVRFVADPFAGAGQRMYRSGDVAIRHGDTLEYLGRSDAQIKLRGFRIELGEVEAALLSTPGVDAVAVAVMARDNGIEQLVGYAVLAGNAESADKATKADVSPTLIRSNAAALLPEYMVPDVVMLLDELPLTVNGKLDRRALPEPEIVADAAYVAPGTETEKMLAEIVADVLDLERVGVADSLFDLGGNSLAAARIVGRAGEALGVGLSVRDVFDAPTVRGLAELSAQRAAGLPEVVALPRPARIPLSFAQSRMWFINQFDTSLPTYNIPALLRLVGDVDVRALRCALTDVIERQEVLRTTFPAVDDEPVQVIGGVDEIDERLEWLEVDSWSQLQNVAASGFDVTTGWPVRAALLAEAPGRWVFALVMHHIASDGESLRPLVTDLITAYLARTAGVAPEFVPLEIQFADYAIWQHDVLGSADDADSIIGRQLGYWTRQLRGLPDVLDLPTDRPRPTVASMRGARTSFAVPAAVTAGVTELARDSGVTPFMVVHAALSALLARLSGTDDIAIATPIAGRGQRVLDPLVGMFVNTLVLRVGVDPTLTFAQLLDRVRGVDLEGFAHADLPFESVVEALDPPRSESYAPLSQVMLTFDQSAMPELAARGVAAARLPGLDVEPIDVDDISAKVDLTFALRDTGDGWSGELVYATDIFDAETAESIARRFTRLLTEITEQPALPVGRSRLLDDREYDELSSVSGGTGATPQLLADVLVDVARRHPDDVAVTDASGDVATYAGLDARSDECARWLIAHGVGTETLVALAIRRSVDLLTALWAVTKVGAGYVPIDPDYPADRIAYMLTDSGVALGLTTPTVREALPSSVAWSLMCDVVGDRREPAVGSAAGHLRPDELVRPRHLDALAYVIYTSGSTGRPKGVAITYRGIGNYSADLARYRADGGSVVMGYSSPSFDASILEWLIASTGGATLAYRPEGAIGGEQLEEFIREAGVTHAFMTPTVAATIDPGMVPGLQLLASGGEALSQRLVDDWAGTVAFFNAYGPTETSVAVANSKRRVGVPVRIGGPIGGVGLFVLDDTLQPVPVNVPGELYVRGVALARGYLGRADLTAARYVADPFGNTGDRLYRTGDVVRWRRSEYGDLELEYSGRSDDQVKLRGLRIELGEVEAGLSSHPDVSAAVVIGVGGSVATALAGYVVAPSGLDVSAVREHLEQRLPAHMVPAHIIVLDALPLTPVGKLDKRALPAPETPDGDDYVAPASTAERRLAAVVAGILGIERVGVTDSFFALGGDSIMSIRLASAARDAGLALTPRDIFEHKTIRAMARAGGDGRAAVALLAEPDGGGAGEVPLSPVVQWLLEMAGEPERLSDFSQSVVMVAPDDLDPTMLASVLDAVVAAHPMLALRLRHSDDGWGLLAGVPESRAATHAVHADTGTGSAEFDELIRAEHAAALGRLDPLAGRVVAAVLVSGNDGARVILAIHHLSVDAVSWPIIIEDVITAWGALSSGTPSALRPEVTSARAWQHALATTVQADGEVDYWLARVGHRTPGFDDAAALGRTAPEPVTVELDPELTEAVLGDLPKAFGAATADVLSAALARAVRAFQDGRGRPVQGPVAMVTEGHGRYEDVLLDGAEPRRADLSRTVGWFTTIAPLVIDPGEDAIHAVKAAKEERLSRRASGLGFGLLRGDARTPLWHCALPAIAINYLGAVGQGAAQDDDTVIPFAVDITAPALASTVSGLMPATNALTANITVRPDERGRALSAEFLYAQDVLTMPDVADLAAAWLRELEALRTELDAIGDPGPSPSDLPGTGITQADIDALTAAYPGSALWPLTPLQHGFVVQSALAGAGAGADNAVDVYVGQTVLRLGAPVDENRLRRAVGGLFTRHPALRTSYLQTAGGAVVAVVNPSVEVPWRIIELGEADEVGRHAAVDDVVAAERVTPFDLAAPPLLRVVVIRDAGGVTVVITNHHILFDGWSGPLVLADLLALYVTGATYTGGQHAPTDDFGDFARSVAGADHAAGLAAWREVLAAVDGPTLVAPGATATTDALPRNRAVPVDPRLVAALESVAREQGSTLATVLQFAWAVLLSRVTGQRVVTFGETVSGRPADLDGVESMVGLFINTLPAVVDVDPSMPIADVLAALGESKVAVLDHQHHGLPGLTALTGVEGDLFDTLTVHESYPVDIESLSTDSSTTGLDLAEVVVSDSTHFPLNMVTSPTGDGGLTITLKYLPSAFDGEQIEVFATALEVILRTVAGQPRSLVADISLVDDDERATIHRWSVGPQVGVPVTTVADAVAAQVVRSPGAPALWCAGRVVSYAEFGARVAVLARELIAVGVGPEVAVGVSSERSVEFVVAIHAVVAAGGQYVPLDTAAPLERVGYMVETAGVGVVLVAAGEVPAAVAELGDRVRVVEVDASGSVDVSVAAVSDAERLSSLSGDAALYTLFTSGSTGRPKGVTVSHRSVLNRLWWGLGEYPWAAGDRVVLKTPVTFDVSVPELFAPLMSGAQVVVARPGGHADPLYLAELIGATRATSVHFVPSMLSVFLDVVPEQRVRELDSLQWVFCSGEALGPATVAAAHRLLPGVSIHNLFGPTEAAVEVGHAEVTTRDRLIPIGIPVANTSMYVLDARLGVVPPGVAGELYLGGVQVA